jgi:hypothetical protein
MNSSTRAICTSVFLFACSSSVDQSEAPGAVTATGGFPMMGAGGFASPGAGGFASPGAGGYVGPGAGGFANPGSGGFVNPGAGGFVNPGAGGLVNPGAGGLVNPGAGGFDPGAGGVMPGAGGVAGTGGTPDPGSGGSSNPPPTNGCGQTLPAVSDYGAMGPFKTTTLNNTGPDGTYTLIRPTTLGENGFKHPVATWGNGITTTPSLYPVLLSTIASQGIVIIASNSTSVTTQMMTTGLDWMVAQNAASGDYQGKLDTKCLISIGYSLGGGAAVTTGGHADVVTTVSFHGLTGASDTLHGPLLLFTSTQDTFVSAAQFVTPTFNRSTVQTFYATLTGAGDAGHLTPINDAGPERAPAIAWLRLWVYGDQAAKKYFYGDDCILCKDPWGNPQRKNWP